MLISGLRVFWLFFISLFWGSRVCRSVLVEGASNLTGTNIHLHVKYVKISHYVCWVFENHFSLMINKAAGFSGELPSVSSL